MRAVTPLGLIADKLAQLKTRADANGFSDTRFLQTLNEACELACGLETYLTICTTPESSALAALASRTRSENWMTHFTGGGTILALEQEMLSGHLEGQFLKMLVSATGARRVLEIGVFTGYSALAMAEALPEDGILVACEIDEFAAAFARSCFAGSPHGAKIQVEVAPAIETLDRLAASAAQFDFVFIDADKASYVTYLEKLLHGALLTPNALICVDNTLMQGQPYIMAERTANGRAIASFNEFVLADGRVEQVLLPIRDGITLIRRI